MKCISASVFSALLLTACHGSPDDSVRPGCRETVATPHALWSEFLEPSAALREVPALLDHGISLYWNVPSGRIGDAETAAFLDRATCAGLEVRAWLTLPEGDGYWPNELNADLFIDRALDLAEWIRASDWPIDWIVVDMEPDLQLMNEIIEAVEEGRIQDALARVLGNRDPEAFAVAAAKYSDLVERLHRMGFRVMVVTFPLVLDDLHDGDEGIQDLMNTPVSPVPWDEVSFMAYTTTFERLLQVPMEPYLVYSYSLDAIRFFGERAAVDLGVFGGGGVIEDEGIRDLRELRAQVGAARAAGVERIHAYSLDGILTLEDEAAWYGAFRSPAVTPPGQAAVDLLRGLIRIADALG